MPVITSSKVGAGRPWSRVTFARSLPEARFGHDEAGIAHHRFQDQPGDFPDFRKELFNGLRSLYGAVRVVGVVLRDAGGIGQAERGKRRSRP